MMMLIPGIIKQNYIYTIQLPIIILCFCISCNAQTAQIYGVVTDSDSALVKSVKIKLVENATGTTQQVTTNGSGAYTIPFLRPGRYTIVVESHGFQSIKDTGMDLEAGQHLRRDYLLRVGITSEIVVIDASSASIETESGNVQTVIDSQFVRNLPLNGRSFQALLYLTPGVVQVNDAGQFSVNGQRANANYYTIDGVSANLGVNSLQVPGQGGAGSLPALSVQGTTNNLISVDALEEFSVITSTYAPEYGRMPGGQISLVSRGGGETYHGSVFDYLRNDKLDANNFFANRNGLKKPPLRQNQFGGVFSGPVWTPLLGRFSKTFFFFSYEGLRLREPETADIIVPSMSARREASPAIKALLNAYPISSGAELSGRVSRFAASYSQPITADAFSMRIDRSAGENLRLFGRITYSPTHQEQRKANVLSNITEARVNNYGFTLGGTINLSTTLVNDIRYNRSVSFADSKDRIDSFGGAILPKEIDLFPAEYTNKNGYVIANFGGGVGSISYGPNGSNESVQNEFVERLSWVEGAHSMKFGADYRRIASRFGINTTEQYRPTYNFGSVTGALTNRLTSAILNVKDVVNLNFTNVSLFAQDAWRFSRRSSVTYGLRWEYNPAPGSPNPNQQPYTIIYDGNLSGISLAPQGTALYQSSKKNFAPRLGGAYQLYTKSGWESVIRGGYGIYFDIGTGVIANAAGAFPFLRTKRLPANTAFPVSAIQSEPLPINAPPPYDLLRAFDPGIKLPRTHQFNFTIEQSLGSNRILSIGYVAARGRKLLRQESISNPNSLTSLLQLTTNGDSSNYDSLQTQFRFKSPKSIRLIASYSFSKSIDTSSTDAGFLPRSDRLPANGDRGPSDFDIRHSFSTAFSYDLPERYSNKYLSLLLSNWGIDTIAYARSAPPFTVTGFRVFDFGFVTVRPDLVLGTPLFINDTSAPGGKKINNTRINNNQIGAFLFTPELRQGTLGRNSLRAFPFHQADIAIRRNFKLKESLSLQARIEMFNAFNHPNFALPNSSLGLIAGNGSLSTNPNFGFANSMLRDGLSGLTSLYQLGGPRSMQISLRLSF